MAVRVPGASSAGVPASDPATGTVPVPEQPAIARDPNVIATRDERRQRPADGASPDAARSSKAGPAESRVVEPARAPERRAPKAAARPAIAAGEPKTPEPAEALTPSAFETSPTPVTSGANALPPAARRNDAESSIITSAPALGADAARAPSAPRANAKTGASPAEPGTKERQPMPTLSGESGLLAGSRAKRDRTKSPGFYSNLAPAHAADKVSAGASQSTLKRTVLGVAPPPELGDGVTTAGRATPSQRGAVSDPALRAATPAAGAAAAATTEAAGPGTERRAAAARATSGAPASASSTETEEKEDTSPGLGHTRSRHDPAVRLDLPEGDLDLLVDFVLDLGLGLAGEAWLLPAREAVARLRAAVARVQKNGLEKALGQLAVELDAPNVLSEERRSRILQALVLVDLALPRPMDVPGQRLVRERLIVQHLVTELATSQPTVARWLRDENIVSLDRLGRLRAEELCEKADIRPEQAAEALGTFRDYLGERARRGPELSLLGKNRALEQRLADLEASAEQFERVADSDDRDEKREARRRRQADIARLSLYLAERGEATMLSELERCSVQGKIARLRRWLTEQPASSVRGAAAELPRQETTG